MNLLQSSGSRLLGHALVLNGAYLFLVSYTVPIRFFLFNHACSQRNQYLVAGGNNLAFCWQLTFPLEAS